VKVRVLAFPVHSNTKMLRLLSQLLAAILSLAVSINGAVNYIYDPVGNASR
jgi:hypothetical protein